MYLETVQQGKKQYIDLENRLCVMYSKSNYVIKTLVESLRNSNAGGDYHVFSRDNFNILMRNKKLLSQDNILVMFDYEKYGYIVKHVLAKARGKILLITKSLRHMPEMEDVGSYELVISEQSCGIRKTKWLSVDSSAIKFCEDNIDTYITKLFNTALGFVGTNGVGNVNQMLSDNSNSIVYIDVVPDNRQTISAYSYLAMKYGPHRVIPIPCAEFCIVFMLLHYGFKMKQTEAAWLVDILSGKHVVYDSDNFEKFCKRCLFAFGLPCVMDEPRNGQFYYKDCLCDECKRKCMPVTMQNKIRYLQDNFVGNWSIDNIEELYRTIYRSIGKGDFGVIKFIFRLWRNYCN